MTTIEIFLLIFVGLFSGFINSIAGGGSLLTMPLLIFMGIPSSEANGTNRVAILIQTLFSVAGYRSKGIYVFPLAIYLAIPAVIGAIIGSHIAIDISDQVFNKMLAIIMLIVIITSVFKPSYNFDISKNLSTKHIWKSVFIFFLLGIYGGFIQAGIGFLIIAILTSLHGFGMAKTNSIKVFVIFSYTLVAVIVFHLEGKIHWEYGLILASGNSIGAWIGSRWSVGKSDRLIRIILLVMVTSLAIKLWFF